MANTLICVDRVWNYAKVFIIDINTVYLMTISLRLCQKKTSTHICIVERASKMPTRKDQATYLILFIFYEWFQNEMEPIRSKSIPTTSLSQV